MKSGLNISSLAGVDTLKADEDELFAWTGKENTQDAISQLSTFVGNIIVTSDGGIVELYRNGELSYKTKPLEVKVKDTTGAGDIMLAALTARLLETNSMREALKFATVASSLSVQNVGIRKAILSRSRIMKELSSD
jgi:ribokinase